MCISIKNGVLTYEKVITEHTKCYASVEIICEQIGETHKMKRIHPFKKISGYTYCCDFVEIDLMPMINQHVIPLVSSHTKVTDFPDRSFFK